jgi:hypothetical protein
MRAGTTSRQAPTGVAGDGRQLRDPLAAEQAGDASASATFPHAKENVVLLGPPALLARRDSLAENRPRSVGEPYWTGPFQLGSCCSYARRLREVPVRFDPDKHRAHQTFESACLERYRTRSGAR